MAPVYLVDTSVLTRLSTPAVRAVVEPMALDQQLARAQITDLEIGYSARNAREWDRLMAGLEAFPLIETSPLQVRRARQIQRQLAERPQRGRTLPDLLVAAAAEESRLTVLHYDGDFDLIAASTGQECRWVVPSGSID